MSKQSNQRYRKELEKQNVSSASNSCKEESSSCYDNQTNRYTFSTDDFDGSITQKTDKK